MSHTLQKPEQATDWFDEICQQLDMLRIESQAKEPVDEIAPPDWLFDAVKDDFQKIRQLAGFPQIPVPDLWIGPEGDIGLTWDLDGRSFDMIFGREKFTARLTTVDFKQQVIERKDVPRTLAKLVA